MAGRASEDQAAELEHSRDDIVVRVKSTEESRNEADHSDCRGHRGRFRMCDDAQDPNLSRWHGSGSHLALSASSSAATPAATAAGHLPGRNDGGRWHGLPDASAPATSAAPAEGRRARMTLRGRCLRAGPLPLGRPVRNLRWRDTATVF